MDSSTNIPPTLYNNKNKTTEVAFNLWMTKELRDELQAIAKARVVSLSALIRLALSQYVKSNK